MTAHVPSIEQLTELGLPAPVSYLPQTWGWWLLLGLLLVGLLAWAGRRYWLWRRDRYRREALARLAELQRSSDPLAALRELPELLKRVALSMPSRGSNDCNANTNVGASLLAKAAAQSTSRVNSRAPSRASSLLQVAALGGEDWQAFLVRHSAQPLPADFSQQLATLAYAPDTVLLALPAAQRIQLFSTCKHWLEHHHVAA
ncbi:alpha-2 type XI collagen [Pseudomonas sp. S04]|uniref:DUF4381 domain-containing protein n=1 Tax=unclassified Pseudomonas TaxID=196821 RepID=UPI00131FB117|nr:MULTISPECIES: DUF4381 domain-containing protein [unclassified Pseudomonas]QHD01378.1 alpha-2 type XI collagen [Pseudomonas sp. S04]QHF33862.1 alpha-2 type XI collagen [Pseudomonas sp. S19]